MDIDKIRSFGIRATTITEKIHVIHGNNRSRSPFSNAILVLDKIHALMDPGCGLDIMEKLAHAVGIDLVITSHSHPDHTSGAWLLQDMAHADVAVPQEHEESISKADKLAVRFVGDDLGELWKNNYLPVTGFRDFTPTTTFAHGHEFALGQSCFIALHTPGHLEDHYCLFEPDQKIVVGFDIDLSPFGPWYGNPESNIVQFQQSIETVSNLPAEVYITSHSKPIKGRFIAKRMEAYARAFSDREHLLLERISTHDWTDLEEVIMESPIYQVDHSRPDKILKYGETQMVTKHLHALEEKGMIIHRDGKYRRAS
jgi:glyoxylase-like metal-dependent hydrolase (beta-lactamase superfamily II)